MVEGESFGTTVGLVTKDGVGPTRLEESSQKALLVVLRISTPLPNYKEGNLT